MAPTIPIIVLAAGSASRFGAPKLAANLNGRPVLQHVLAAARMSGVGDTWLVTGGDETAVLHAADGLADYVVANPDHGSGMGTSVARGIEACRSGADAALILLGDQPRVTAGHIERIAAAWSGDANEIVATDYGSGKGPPVLFGEAAFADLLVLDGDAGGRHLFGDERFTLKLVEFGDAADIDTPEDLARLRNAQ